MESNIIDNISTDLRNLPKIAASENFEQNLANRIAEYEISKQPNFRQTSPVFGFFKNPIFAPALSLAIVTVLILFAVNANSNLRDEGLLMLPKAKSKLSEDNSLKDIPIPNKIVLPKKKEIVVARNRNREPIQLGPGVSLDQPLSTSTTHLETIETNAGFSFPSEPTLIRIPPPAQYGPQRTVGFESTTNRTRDTVISNLRRNK